MVIHLAAVKVGAESCIRTFRTIFMPLGNCKREKKVCNILPSWENERKKKQVVKKEKKEQFLLPRVGRLKKFSWLRGEKTNELEGAIC